MYSNKMYFNEAHMWGEEALIITCPSWNNDILIGNAPNLLVAKNGALFEKVEITKQVEAIFPNANLIYILSGFYELDRLVQDQFGIGLCCPHYAYMPDGGRAEFDEYLKRVIDGFGFQFIEPDTKPAIEIPCGSK